MGDVMDILIEMELYVEGHSKDFDVLLEWEGDRAELHLSLNSL